MFVSTPDNQVIAIDATSGSLLWRYRRPRLPARSCSTNQSRRCFVRRQSVFCGGEAVVVALDAKTGREVWTSTSPTTSRRTTSRSRRSSRAARSWSARRAVSSAFAASSRRSIPIPARRLWRTYTIPAPGEPGSETWSGDQWKTGGAPIWVTGNYDPETNLAFLGNGNGGPTIGDQRPGDNLYSTSMIALDVAPAHQGLLQYHPNDSWDWDEVSPPILVDYRRNGRTIKGLIDVARDGYLWFLERSAGRCLSRASRSISKRLQGPRPRTGRPDVDLDRNRGTGKGPITVRTRTAARTGRRSR